jgi:hypothetical protein
MLLLLLSCKSELDRDSYIAWVRSYSNGLHVSSEYNDFVFDLQYQPSEYFLLQRTNGNITNANWNIEKKEIESMKYFILSISIKNTQVDLLNYNVGSEDEKQRRSYYLSYLFQNDITLEQGGESLPCILFHFERAVNTNNTRIFVLGFENNNPALKFDEPSLTLNSDIFSSLPIKIKTNLKDIPSLAL